MNKRLDFTKNGGFPATQYTLKYMQDSYRGAFAALANLIGSKVIVCGVEEVGGQVTDGWISIDGELMPFTGGPLVAGASIAITEDLESRLFDDGQSNDVYFTKRAAFGTPGSFPYTDLVRLESLKTMGVPKGTVLMWSGNVDALPQGYALCDGTLGTPNLKGRFIVGYDPTDVDYDTLAKTGGEKKHTLTISEMPAHSHSVNTGDQNGRSDDANDRDVMIPSGGMTKNTTSVGGSQPHENRPPFYVLAYIIKL